jgi:hypothetical protein
MGCATIRGCGSGFGTSPGNIIPACKCAAPVYSVRGIQALQDNSSTYVTDPSTGMIAAVNAYDITTIPWGSIAVITYEPGGSTSVAVSPISAPAPWFPAQNYQYQAAPLRSSSLCSQILTWTTYGPGNNVFPNGASFSRCQIYLPFPTAYYVIAYGGMLTATGQQNPSCTFGLSCGYNSVSQACIYAEQSSSDYPLIVDLAVPDQSLDSSVCVNNYYFGLITPGSPAGSGFCNEGGEAGPPGGFWYNSGCNEVEGFQNTTPDISELAAAAYNGCGCCGPMYSASQICSAPPADPFGAPWP